MNNMTSLSVNNHINISANMKIPKTISTKRCALVPAQNFVFSQNEKESCKKFIKDWEVLEIDPYMADGGSYRFRRYGIFKLNLCNLQLTYQPEGTFYQSLKTNPLNGGVSRKFAPLSSSTLKNTFLHSLIRLDFLNLPDDVTNKSDSWMVGVHQIKTRAVPGSSASPTPEGVHRDDEAFTVQHLIHRENIAGGENFFYGNAQSPALEVETKWMQTDFFDSYYFDKSVWHSVSPIRSLDGINEGYRDVLLLDFIPGEDVMSEAHHA